MAPRTGRPPAEKPRDYVFQMRLNEDERAAFEEAAEKAGKPMATWGREELTALTKRKR